MVCKMIRRCWITSKTIAGKALVKKKLLYFGKTIYSACLKLQHNEILTYYLPTKVSFLTVFFHRSDNSKTCHRDREQKWDKGKQKFSNRTTITPTIILLMPKSLSNAPLLKICLVNSIARKSYRAYDWLAQSGSYGLAYVNCYPEIMEPRAGYSIYVHLCFHQYIR